MITIENEFSITEQVHLHAVCYFFARHPYPPPPPPLNTMSNLTNLVTQLSGLREHNIVRTLLQVKRTTVVLSAG